MSIEGKATKLEDRVNAELRDIGPSGAEWGNPAVQELLDTVIDAGWDYIEVTEVGGPVQIVVTQRLE